MRAAPGQKLSSRALSWLARATRVPNQVVAAAHQAAQGLDGVGLRRERAQAVAVGAQDVGQDEGVARVALGGDGAVARPAGLDAGWDGSG